MEPSTNVEKDIVGDEKKAHDEIVNYADGDFVEGVHFHGLSVVLRLNVDVIHRVPGAYPGLKLDLEEIFPSKKNWCGHKYQSPDQHQRNIVLG